MQRVTATLPTSTASSAETARQARGGLRALIATSDDSGALIARLALGLVMLPHGAQKLLGWFGGYGFSGTLDGLTGHLGLPWLVAFLVIVVESFGALALILGSFGRLAALGIGAVMIGATFTVHLQHGFFMNWAGNQGGEGFEFHLLALGLALVTVVKGSGALSLDRWWSERRGW